MIDTHKKLDSQLAKFKQLEKDRDETANRLNAIEVQHAELMKRMEVLIPKVKEHKKHMDKMAAAKGETLAPLVISGLRVPFRWCVFHDGSDGA